MRALYLSLVAIAAIILAGNLSQVHAAQRAPVSQLLSSGAPDQAKAADTLPPQGKGPLEPYREFRKIDCSGTCSLPFAKVSKDKLLEVEKLSCLLPQHSGLVLSVNKFSADSNFIGFINQSPDDGISNATGPFFFAAGERLVVTGTTSGSSAAQPFVCTASGYLVPVDNAPEP